MEEPHLEIPVNGEAMVMEEPDLSLSKGRDSAPLLKDKAAISEDLKKSENDGSIAIKGHSENAAEDLNDSSVNGSNDLVSAEELKKLNMCGQIVVSEDCVGVNGSGDKDTINNEVQNGNSEKLTVDGEKMAIRENGDASANESAKNTYHESMADQNGVRLAAELDGTLKSDENVREQSEIVLNQITASSSLPLVHDSNDGLSGELEDPNITSDDSQLSSADDSKEQEDQKEEEKEHVDESQLIEEKGKQSHDEEGIEEVAQTKDESLEQTAVHQGGTVNIEQVITGQDTEDHKTNEMEVAAVAEYSGKKQEKDTDYTSQTNADDTVEEKSLENHVEKENYTVLSETPNENPENLLTGNDTLVDEQLSPCNSTFVIESCNSFSQHEEEEKPALEDTTENQTREEEIETVTETVKENINVNISLSKCNQEELITQETSEITKRVTDNELCDNTEVEQEISPDIKLNICEFGDSESVVKHGEICEQGTEQSSNSDYEEKYETEEVENINKRNSSSMETKLVSDEGDQQRTDSVLEHTDNNNMEVTMIENEAKVTKDDVEGDNTVLKEEIVEETVNTNTDINSEHEESKIKELQAEVEDNSSEGKSNEDIKDSDDDDEGPALPLSPPPDQQVFQGVETRGRLSSAGLGRERTSWLYAHMLNETSGEDDAMDADEDKAVDREKQGEDDEVGAEMTEEEQGLDSNIKTAKESENKENKDMDGQVEQGVNVDVAMMTKAGKQDLNTSKRVGKDELDSHGEKDELDSQGTDKSNEENKENSGMNNELEQEERGAHYVDETKEEEKNEGKNAGDQEAKETDTQTTLEKNKQEDKCKVVEEENNTNKDSQNEIDKQNLEMEPQTTQQELSAISKQEEETLMLREVSEVEIVGGEEEKDKDDGKEERAVVEEGSECITEKPDREVHKQVEHTAVHQGGTANIEQIITEQGTEDYKTNEMEIAAVAEYSGKEQDKHADTDYTSQTNADDTVTSMSDTDRHEETKTDTTEATDKYIQLDSNKHDEDNTIQKSELIETKETQITKISTPDMQETPTEETDRQISKTDSENKQVTRDYKEDATDEPEHQQEPTDSDPEVDQTIQQSKQDQETQGLQRLTGDFNNQTPADKSCKTAITDTEEEGEDLKTRKEVETKETDIKEERRVQEEEGKELETKETDIKEERRVQEDEGKELEAKETDIKERKEHETKEMSVQEDEKEIDTKENVVDDKKELEVSGKEAEKDQTQTENHKAKSPVQDLGKQELHKETNTEPFSSTEKEDSVKDQVADQDTHKAATEDLTPKTDEASAHNDAQESETNEQQLRKTNQSELGEEKNVTADTKESKTEVEDSSKTEEKEAQAAAIVDAEEDKENSASGDEQRVEESKKENGLSEGDEATATTKVKKGKKAKKKCTVM